jgi:hypothetical protein
MSFKGERIMRTIRTRYDKYTTKTAQVCGACHYAYETMFDATPGILEETIVLDGTDNGSRPFIRLLDKNLIKISEDIRAKTVNLYACPRCLTVQLDDEEIYD